MFRIEPTWAVHLFLERGIHVAQALSYAARILRPSRSLPRRVMPWIAPEDLTVFEFSSGSAYTPSKLRGASRF